MGQQQLLLLVLATIIIGLATVAAIDAFDQGQHLSAVNHMTQTSIEIASDVQEYAARPDFMRPKNTTGNDELVIDFGELIQYETNDASGDGDHIDETATYSLNGHYASGKLQRECVSRQQSCQYR